MIDIGRVVGASGPGGGIAPLVSSDDGDLLGARAPGYRIGRPLE